VSPPLDDRTIARLLSKKNLPSVLEKEAIFERILERVEAEKDGETARTTRFAWVWALGLAAAAAVALLWWAPAREPPAELAARGAGDEHGVALELSCGRAAAPCRVSGSLAFELGPAPSTLYFAAFARRADGTIIWYFPEADAPSLKVSASTAPHVLERAVTLGPEHTPGNYELFALFSKQPLTRAQLKAALGPELSGGANLRVLRRSFEVAP
jgi:hypothetical protein